MNIGESYFRREEERGKCRFNLSRQMGTLEGESKDTILSVYRRKKEERSNIPEVTLSSVTEANRQESTIPVLKQRSYTGRKVIPSALANTLCADIGVDGILEKLNTILGTTYTFDAAISVLDCFIALNYDFGTAYAYLRNYWHDIPTLEDKLSTQEEKDREMRRSVLVGRRTRVIYADIPPRRVWDLYANRVVPYWVVRAYPRPISHAWVDEKDRVNVMSPINGYQWPVPMPKDANLDLIRIEMLNTIPQSEWVPIPEYAWLDVLCLRQEGGKNEHLRLDEWKLDVPTIGSVYQQKYPHPLCYLNGLGRPLYLPMDYFESDRCWFRRAWTLQEITDEPIIGGETGNNVVRRRFNERLTSMRGIISSGTTLDLVFEMRHRVSTQPLDKVAGLVYLLKMNSIPIYDTEQSAADAWEVLMDIMAPGFRAELLFFYPEPGNRSKCWRPSWEQVMTNRIVTPRFAWYPSQVYRMEDPDADYYEGYHIELGDVWGLSEVSKELKPRRGWLILKDAHGYPHMLRIVADHAYPIPDGSYSLIGHDDRFSDSELWVVGHLREDGRFEKLSVFRSADDEQATLRKLRLEQSKIALC